MKYIIILFSLITIKAIISEIIEYRENIKLEHEFELEQKFINNRWEK